MYMKLEVVLLPVSDVIEPGTSTRGSAGASTPTSPSMTATA